jgi:hypothetical protein
LIGRLEEGGCELTRENCGWHMHLSCVVLVTKRKRRERWEPQRSFCSVLAFVVDPDRFDTDNIMHGIEVVNLAPFIIIGVLSSE